MKKIAAKKILLSSVLILCLLGLVAVAGVSSQESYPNLVTFHEIGLPNGAVWSVGFGLSLSPSVSSSYTVGDPYAHLNSGGDNCISFYTSWARTDFYFTVPAAIGAYQVATISPSSVIRASYKNEAGPNTISVYITVDGNLDITITYSAIERYIVFAAKIPYYQASAKPMVIDGIEYSANTETVFTWDVGSTHSFTFVSPIVDDGTTYEWILTGGSWDHPGLSTARSESSFTVTDAGVVFGYYKRSYEVMFEVDPPGSGTIDWSGPEIVGAQYGSFGTYLLEMWMYGEYKTFHISASPQQGYTFSSWTVDPSSPTAYGNPGIWFNPNSPYGSEDPNSDYTYIDIGAPGTITAHFVSTGPPTTDTTPPTTTKSLTGSEGNNGWFKSSVDVSLTSVDNVGGSGVKEIHYILDGVETVVSGSSTTFTISTEGTHTLEHWSVDNAENGESHVSQDINIDWTPPTITIDIPHNGGTYTLNQEVKASWSATDDLSGIASASGIVPNRAYIDTSTLGTKTFWVTATDNAGNTATKTVSYEVVLERKPPKPPHP